MLVGEGPGVEGCEAGGVSGREEEVDSTWDMVEVDERG